MFEIICKLNMGMQWDTRTFTSVALAEASLKSAAWEMMGTSLAEAKENGKVEIKKVGEV